MAGPNYQTDCHGETDILKTLSSHGIEFLLSGEDKVPLSSLCDEKTICLYFSANWCRPCKTFTPQLVKLFSTLRTQGEKLEIIYISFDNNEKEFEEHFKSMPWLAVPFNLDLHKFLIRKYHINQIPSVLPLSLLGGVPSNEHDLVGLIEDYGVEAFPFTKERIEELKYIDCAKLEGGKLEELLGHEGRNFVIFGDGRKVLVSELVGKTVGLFFGAYWCPPSRVFSTKLKEAYNELKNTTQDNITNNPFDIILVSTDRNMKEFELNITEMPWLAIPYEDKTRQDLYRIFNVKGIPALVLIGPDGKAISANGKAMISLYGAQAYPFTESRIIELESELKKEGEALPSQVKDIKHEHVLKLEMAKAYVCDCCKNQGRFWAFSCDVCDYDLHPSCLEIQ